LRGCAAAAVTPMIANTPTAINRAIGIRSEVQSESGRPRLALGSVLITNLNYAALRRDI
jgi:hypothetical protein